MLSFFVLFTYLVANYSTYSCAAERSQSASTAYSRASQGAHTSTNGRALLLTRHSCASTQADQRRQQQYARDYSDCSI
jgi:hypothetical protein